MALIRVKRCRSCAHKLVENEETKVWECKNHTCPEYVPDKPVVEESLPVEPTGSTEGAE